MYGIKKRKIPREREKSVEKKEEKRKEVVHHGEKTEEGKTRWWKKWQGRDGGGRERRAESYGEKKITRRAKKDAKIG